MASQQPMELWAGFECTVARIQDDYVDQIVLTGHQDRLADLQQLAELGVTKVRYPVLWERVAPQGLESADWSWSDERLTRLRELSVEPIVGLLHHGSGPRSTSLVHHDFPGRFAEYAHSVAQRYPWVTHWTPVNEPLTTARFSGLYGHWYPHGRDDSTFTRALLQQCRAVVVGMQAIRAINASAQLVQSEDLGKTFSTPLLQYQSDFENERRWLSFDLLCGRVEPGHPMWSYLLQAGAAEHELRWFQEHPCPPDIMGLNHYLSSERFLDEGLDRYPPETWGGNGRDRYADMLAARVRADGPVGPRRLILEAWERYHLPLAITEAHNGCTREEQIRWLAEVWQGAEHARNRGADVRAVTAWALLGAFDWDSLLTDRAGRYEPGVFDLRAPRPRRTAAFGLLEELARGQAPTHPVVEASGWWRRPDRLIYGRVADSVSSLPAASGATRFAGLQETRDGSAPVILVTGATGTLGKAVALACHRRGLPHWLVTRQELDIADVDSVRQALEQIRPWAVVNTAGYVRVDDAERDQERCYRENARGPETLAEACAQRGIKLVTFSSDLVFDGAKGQPYLESDLPNPLNVYGESKRAAEEGTLQRHPSSLVIRTSAFFGPQDAYNFVTCTLDALRTRGRWAAVADTIISPTYVPDLVEATLDLLIDGERGIWHLATPAELSWHRLACMAAECAGFDPSRVTAMRSADAGWLAQRPRYSALRSERGSLMPPLEQALGRYVSEMGGFSREDIACSGGQRTGR